MKYDILAQEYITELHAEVAATRKCLERIPPENAAWKPHEKSMEFGYLTLLVAEIPLWIAVIARDSEIDLATFEHQQFTSTEELLQHFDDNVAAATSELQKLSGDDVMSEPFYLKSNGQTIYTSTKREQISSSINHMVHHRGQLTVYMRLNDIAVPSIYGPSADDKNFSSGK